MGMITCEDGLEKVGQKEVRQFPQKHVWSSTIWCARRGDCFRRFYNPADRAFTWSEPIELALQEETGRMGLYITGKFVPIETIIASAWRMRAPNSNAPVERVGPRRQITAKHLRWGDEEEADDDDQSPIQGETWSPLKCKCGIVPCNGRGYDISNKGRLRNAEGRITRGIAFAGSRWGAVKGCGLVDLYVAAGINEAPEASPPCIQDALHALMSGDSPDDMLPFTNATIKSLWSYFARAVEWADPSDLKLVWTLLVPDDLVRLLKQLKREGNSALGGTLTDLHQIVSERLPPESLFHDELTWEKLRFARACVVATMRP